jgi:heme/copper-type cytochrome/quinol oxidase subunit 2
MADETNATHEIKQHTQTWGGFVTMMTWGTAICVVVALAVVVLIAS